MASPYHCEPPFYPDPGEAHKLVGGRHKLYLVCGRFVEQPGVYTSWPSADAQYKHISGATVKSYRDYNELKAAWYTRCNRGEHDHPPDPQLPAGHASQSPPASSAGSSTASPAPALARGRPTVSSPSRRHLYIIHTNSRSPSPVSRTPSPRYFDAPPVYSAILSDS
ncbi:hypothetical protein K438DRAFT_1967355 [Mycena galopus ATCC 62051]|nr:hypothetical protein K438DRAFT_1967355 [Mycena galopus ATCC 62051]